MSGKKQIRKLQIYTSYFFSISVICANPPNVRALMLGAQRAGMVDSGQFVFFNMDLFDITDIDKYMPWIDENATEEENEEAQHAFQSVLTVTAGTASSSSDNYTIFSSRVRQLAQEYFNYSHEEDVSTFAANFYDAALLYCHGN
jgi:atrial natriuretic peptide receptor A